MPGAEGQIYHSNSTPVPPVTFSLGHFFFTGIRKRQLQRQKKPSREGERGERDGSEERRVAEENSGCI